MQVLDIKENEDGSATFNLELSDTEKALLLETGLRTILEDYIYAMDLRDADMLRRDERESVSSPET